MMAWCPISDKTQSASMMEYFPDAYMPRLNSTNSIFPHSSFFNFFAAAIQDDVMVCTRTALLAVVRRIHCLSMDFPHRYLSVVCAFTSHLESSSKVEDGHGCTDKNILTVEQKTWCFADDVFKDILLVKDWSLVQIVPGNPNDNQTVLRQVIV